MIGLIGWQTATGNGAMNYDIASYLNALWLAPQHPRMDYHAPYHTDKTIKCMVHNDEDKYNNFLDQIDALIFVERPYLDWPLILQCRERKIVTLCIPMWEWLPNDAGWLRQTDLMWAVTKYTRQYLEKHSSRRYSRWANDIYGEKWGVNLDLFPFIEKKTANRFLFSNGNGGVGGRKGADIIAGVAARIPYIDITMLTQNLNYPEIPPNVKVSYRTYNTRPELYSYGDVFLAPTHWEGLGHQLYESQASGLPLICTNGPPMNESKPEYPIRVSSMVPTGLFSKNIMSLHCDVEQLVNTIKEINGTDISEKSRRARENIEENFNLKETLAEIKFLLELKARK